MPYSTSVKRKKCLQRFRLKRLKNGQCIRCGKPAEAGKTHCVRCSKKQGSANSERIVKLRNRVIDGYGGCCVCCGVAFREFLAIDHKEYRACEEPKKFGHKLTSVQLCKLIIEQGFPTTYQILCHNCNMALGIYGYCPHHPEITRVTGHLKS